MKGHRNAAAPGHHSEGEATTEAVQAINTATLPVYRAREAVTAAVGGAFVAVVETTGGRHRRRAFLTLAAADKAARSATDRGHNALVMLCELTPVAHVIADEAPQGVSA